MTFPQDGDELCYRMGSAVKFRLTLRRFLPMDETDGFGHYLTIEPGSVCCGGAILGVLPMEQWTILEEKGELHQAEWRHCCDACGKELARGDYPFTTEMTVFSGEGADCFAGTGRSYLAEVIEPWVRRMVRELHPHPLVVELEREGSVRETIEALRGLIRALGWVEGAVDEWAMEKLPLFFAEPLPDSLTRVPVQHARDAQELAPGLH